MTDPASAHPRRRRRVLGLALAATCAASVWALGDDDGLQVARPRKDRPPAAAGDALPVHDTRLAQEAKAGEAPAADTLALPDRRVMPSARRDLFAAAEPVAAPPAPVAAPAPAAIALPFTYGGRLVTDQGTSVLLNMGGATQVLAVGGTLGEFRFERDGGSQLEFIHLPSGERFVLAPPP